MTLFSLVIAFLMPVYSKYFANKDFKFVFHFNQIVYIFEACLHLIISMRFHEKINLPSWVLYGFIGNVMENIEKTITKIPVNVIISEVTPLGIESSMLCFSSTICNMNIQLKSLTGVLINSVFI